MNASSIGSIIHRSVFSVHIDNVGTVDDVDTFNIVDIITITITIISQPHLLSLKLNVNFVTKWLKILKLCQYLKSALWWQS